MDFAASDLPAAALIEGLVGSTLAREQVGGGCDGRYANPGIGQILSLSLFLFLKSSRV